MTIRGLINELKKIEEVVGERAYVTIDLTEFREIGKEYSHWKLHKVDDDVIPWPGIDGERENKDGTEKMRHVVVLS